MGIVVRTKDKGLSKKNKFGKIGVLMGGPSSEREISLKSGEAVYRALRDRGLEVSALDIKTDDPRENIRLIKGQQIECAFLALHGRFGEDGQVQEILEGMGIPYTGSGPQASRLAMDKIASRKIFKNHKLKVPEDKILNRKMERRITEGLNFPLVVKPASQGSSIGLSIIEKEGDLTKGLDLAFNFDERIIIEEYIRGREFTVGILDEEALPVIEIMPKKNFFDYEAKYQPGMTNYVVPAHLEENLAGKIKEAGLSAHQLLGCFGCSRVDMILSQDNLIYILEVNTIPGLTTLSLLPKAASAQGIEFSQLCLKLIQLAYETRPSTRRVLNEEERGEKKKA